MRRSIAQSIFFGVAVVAIICYILELGEIAKHLFIVYTGKSEFCLPWGNLSLSAFQPSTRKYKVFTTYHTLDDLEKLLDNHSYSLITQ